MPCHAEHEHSLTASMRGTKYNNIRKPLQKADFKGLFPVMAGLPVTIRLLDIPLHQC